MTPAEHATQLEQLAERVAAAEARAAVAEAKCAEADKHIGWYYRKWAAAEARAKRLETGKVQAPIEHGGVGL